MDSSASAPTSIDAYIAACPAEVRPVLEAVRRTIREAAPQATEKISYQMPTFDLHGNLVHFAAHSEHVGFYPTPSGIDGLGEAAARYRSGKGTMRFPLSEPMPLDLITEIVRMRVAENVAKAQAKRARKKAKG